MSERLRWIDKYHFISPDVNGKPRQYFNILEPGAICRVSEVDLSNVLFPEEEFLNQIRNLNPEEREAFVNRSREVARSLDGPGGP